MWGPVSGAGGEAREKYLLISQKSQSRESSHDISHCPEVVIVVTFINLNLDMIVFSTVHLLVPGACRGYAEIEYLELINYLNIYDFYLI